MESDVKEGSTVGRSQNVLYVLPHDWASMAHFLGPLIDRIDATDRSLQVLIVTADPESAATAAAAAVRVVADREIHVMAATGARRASRLLALQSPHMVIGDSATLLELARATVLKLDTVRAVAIAWADELLAANGDAALEALMVDVPKNAARNIVTSRVTPEVDALAERYARRARRVVATGGEEGAPIAVQYLATSEHARLPILRRLLDETDPTEAAIYVRSDDSERDTTALTGSLGYRGTDAPIRVTRGGAGAELVVLYDLPASREELREAVGPNPRRVIALVQPRQMESMRAMVGAASMRPFQLSDPAIRARSRDETLRAELRQILHSSAFGRELLALEPLLDEYDGIEVAAAVLQLLQAERVKLAAVPPTPTGDTKKIFLGVGLRDNVKASDLVGAITGEAGVSSGDLGRVEIRESHSIVEVQSHVAPTVIAKMDGTAIRGRRVVAREDLGREERPVRRGAADGPRGSGGPSGARRGPPRGDAPTRGRPAPGEADRRPPRARSADAGPRGPSDREREGRPPAREPRRGDAPDYARPRPARPPRPREDR